MSFHRGLAATHDAETSARDEYLDVAGARARSYLVAGAIIAGIGLAATADGVIRLVLHHKRARQLATLRLSPWATTRIRSSPPTSSSPTRMRSSSTIEGLISASGAVASTYVTPPHGVGSCAKKLVKGTRFPEGPDMRPLPKLSVTL